MLHLPTDTLIVIGMFVVWLKVVHVVKTVLAVLVSVLMENVVPHLEENAKQLQNAVKVFVQTESVVLIMEQPVKRIRTVVPVLVLTVFVVPD